MFYAAHNTHADLINGNRGFLNSWEFSRFKTRAERDAFVEEFENKNARNITRIQAARRFKDNYRSVGKPVPVGGLFAKDQFDLSRFWNEYTYYCPTE